MTALWAQAPKGILTTGIGSLPHPYVDAALPLCFSVAIPFLPQLPAKSRKEFMIAQALDRLPGLEVEEGGSTFLNEKAWRVGTDTLREQTERAFGEDSAEAFEAFEPNPEVWSAWNPFLWELQERDIRLAKVHLAGPLTCQWALQTKEGQAVDRVPEIATQIFRLTLARAIAMCRRLQKQGVTPFIFLDEPGFYAFSSHNPRHVLSLQELRLFIQSLRKEQALVGIHCCSNTHWPSVLSLPLDVLSFDTNLSMEPILQNLAALKSFTENGGRLSLGVVPTGNHPLKVQSFKPELLFENLMNTLTDHLVDEPKLLRHILSSSLVTPACGLALHSVSDANLILSHTLHVAEHFARAL